MAALGLGQILPTALNALVLLVATTLQQDTAF